MKPKPLIVLRALLIGIPVKLGNYEYKLFREGDQVPLTGTDTGIVDTPYFLHCRHAKFPGQAVYLSANNGLSLTTFLRLADNLSDEDATLLAANSRPELAEATVE